MEDKVTAYTVRITNVSTNKTSAGTSPSGNQTFSTLLTEAIDRTLTELLGAKVNQALWSRMSREMLLGKDDAIKHVGKLASFLENIMGTASKTVERRILKRLYVVLNREFSVPVGFNFEKEIERARILWDERQ